MKSGDPWRAVADPTRRRLIELLRDGPRTTGELCRAFSTTRFAVMKHLAVLAETGVIVVRRAGRQRWNQLDVERLRLLGEHWDWAGANRSAGPGLPPGSAAPGRLRGVAAAAEPAEAALQQDLVERGLCPALLLHFFIDAPPWRVFDALTVNVSAWWGAPHLSCPDASNLTIEPQPGGRFIEEWGHRQGALRGLVTAIRRDERLELTGTTVAGIAGVLDIRLERREGGTGLRAALRPESGGAANREEGRGALDDLLGTRLKAFVEQGTRSGVTP